MLRINSATKYLGRYVHIRSAIWGSQPPQVPLDKLGTCFTEFILSAAEGFRMT